MTKCILNKHIIYKHIRRLILAIIDVTFVPITIMSALLLRYIKRRLPIFQLSRKLFFMIGVFPIIDHYYEPLFNPKHLRYSLRDKRHLPAIDFNDREQLDILSCFDYNNELLQFPLMRTKGKLEYYYNCVGFESGDAEYLYNMIRYYKPKRIIEVGSGHSTLMAQNALRKNMEDSDDYTCDHICIEPYEMDWLNTINVSLIRDKVENVDISLFKSLKKNDILFIDSSHVIRPQGDVLFEYLEILPALAKGVMVHIHDIFTQEII